MASLLFLVRRRKVYRDPFVRELVPSASDSGPAPFLRFPDGLVRKSHHKKARQSVVHVRFHPGRLSRQAIKAGCKYSRVHINLFLLVLTIIYIILSYVPEFSNHFLVNKNRENPSLCLGPSSIGSLLFCQIRKRIPYHFRKRFRAHLHLIADLPCGKADGFAVFCRLIDAGGEEFLHA